jgi:hypothetical protein
MADKLETLSREAPKYTTEEQAMKKCGLEKTAYDHLIVGGTPEDERMIENPNTPLAMLMSEQEIEKRLEQSYRVCSESYPRHVFEADIKSQIEREGSVKSPLTVMILYLAKIERVPKRYQHLIKQNKNKVK